MTEFDNDPVRRRATPARRGSTEPAADAPAAEAPARLDVEDEVYGVTAEDKYNEAAEEQADEAWAEAAADSRRARAPRADCRGWRPRRPTAEERTRSRSCGAELRRAPGDWFVVHSYAGYENKVKTNLESRISSLDMEDYIYQVEVPTEEVIEIKNGKRQQVNRKVFPGYILVRMDLTDDSWGAVRNTPGVTGFVGATSKPSPLSMDEVIKILAPAVPEVRRPSARPAAGGR